MAVTEYSPTDEGSGIHTITLEVCDDDGLCGAGQAEVTVTNAVPTVTSVTSDGPVDEGSVVSVSASFTDAGVADIHTATIDWGEGPVMATVVQGAGSGTVSGDHTFAADGTFPVEVCVTDDDADVDCDSSLSVVVNNVAPTVTAGAAQVGVTGVDVTLNAVTFTDPGDSGLHTASINWGDGSLIP